MEYSWLEERLARRIGRRQPYALCLDFLLCGAKEFLFYRLSIRRTSKKEPTAFQLRVFAAVRRIPKGEGGELCGGRQCDWLPVGEGDRAGSALLRG